MSNQDTAAGRKQTASNEQMVGTEIWKPIPGYEVYEASSWGRIRRDGLVRKVVVKRNGYQEITLSTNGKPRFLSVHRLVLSTFATIPIGYVVNHKDGNKLNNHLNNLEAVLPSENFKHSRMYRVLRGEKVNTAKLSKDKVLDIRSLASQGATTSEIMKKYPLARSTINRICSRKYWTHV